MVDISAETWNKAGVDAINIHENDNVDKTVLLLLCISDLGKSSGCKNIYDLIDKEIRLFKGSKHSMYVHEDIAIGIIMQSRLSTPKMIKFRADLRFNQINLILKKEQSVVIPLLKPFSAEKLELQHKILKNERVRTDMYFSERKFAVEIDEKGHIDRNQNEANERQINIEKYSDCKFFHRINPDIEGFGIFLEISKIQTYITQSNENLKSKIAKELLNYMSSISKPLEYIRYFIEKILSTT